MLQPKIVEACFPEPVGAMSRIALIGNFLPRRCGVATFTTHIHDALCARYPDLATDVYAMDDGLGSYSYPPAVVSTIEQQKVAAYLQTAEMIARRGSDLIWIQHEFGIFGGPAGEHLLTLLEQVDVPVIITLHTVLSDPSREQRAVMDRLLGRASLVIVMAERARAILCETYGAKGDRITVVPHGVPARAYQDPRHMRQMLRQEERPTIMTFGLLAADKGIETMIRAMPAIVAHCPSAIYRIVGATHPHVLAHEGEAYREGLQALACSLGVAGHLRWDNRFLDEPELLDQIACADIYVTPYRNSAQITSGTLSYAAGLGKPIVSTPYVHAQELLADGRGCLVPFDDATLMAEAIVGLFQDAAKRDSMRDVIYRHSRDAVWTNVVSRILEVARERVFVPVSDDQLPIELSEPFDCIAA